MISTSAFGSASLASTQARAGRFFASTQAVHTSFIGARLRISVTQMVADRSFDLLEPHFASSRSISSTIRKLHSTHFRALRKMRIQGESSALRSGDHDSCTLRKTRSGCGMTMVKRPSGVVSPVMPRGEPLGL